MSSGVPMNSGGGALQVIYQSKALPPYMGLWAPKAPERIWKLGTPVQLKKLKCFSGTINIIVTLQRFYTYTVAHARGVAATRPLLAHFVLKAAFSVQKAYISLCAFAINEDGADKLSYFFKVFWPKHLKQYRREKRQHKINRFPTVTQRLLHMAWELRHSFSLQTPSCKASLL